MSREMLESELAHWKAVAKYAQTISLDREKNEQLAKLQVEVDELKKDKEYLNILETWYKKSIGLGTIEHHLKCDVHMGMSLRKAIEKYNV